MSSYYAFNGDADGLCALQQLRLAEPPQRQPPTLITGVKRDIQLLQRIDMAAGDDLTVLDISLDQNRDDVARLIRTGASVRYFDHHHAGEVPQHPRFEPYIEEAPNVCTSILVDRFLCGRHSIWAIVAAFGDSLPEVGSAMARSAGLPRKTISILEKLGIYLNYNAYGEVITDLHFDPAELADAMLPFADPLAFVTHSEIYAQLAIGYEEDMHRVRKISPVWQVPGAMLLMLPDESWARRAIGVFANELMFAQPDCAIGILSPKTCGGFTVSVRVPAHSQVGAAEFCRNFDTGGGRRLAGGINHLPEADFNHFSGSFETCFRLR